MKTIYLVLVFGTVGFLMVFLSQFLDWSDSIVFIGYKAFGIPLFGANVFPPTFFYPLSYGMGITFLLMISLIAADMRRPIAVAWCAYLLILMGINYPLRIGFSEPTCIETFLNCRDQYLLATHYSAVNSTQISAPALAATTLLNVDGMTDRLLTAWTALDRGWTFHMLGSILFFISALTLIRDYNQIKGLILLAPIMLAIVLVWNLGYPAIGEAYWNFGLRAERTGHFDEAKNDYRLALYYDKWNRLVSRVYERLGSIDEAQNLHSPEYHFQQGLYQASQNNPDNSLAELLVAMKTKDHDLRRVADFAYALVATSEALPLANSSASVSYLDDAAKLIPDSPVGPRFVESWALENSYQFDAASKEILRAQSNEIVLKSIIFAVAGDIDFLDGNTQQARLAYLQSLAATAPYIEIKNSRAFKALAGNTEQ